MEKKQFNWAILGPGFNSRRFANAIRAVPGAALFAVGSRDGARAEAFAAEFGAPVACGSYEELAGIADVDAVYIATPHTAHCENAVLCLERGKPVLCEKPISINARQARRMADAARANGAFLMEAMWTRFLPAMTRVRELLASGAIGEPRMLTADFSYSARPDPSSRNFDPALGGGGLLDVGIYVLSLSSMVFGPRPEETSSFARIGQTGVDEHAALLLKYPGGGVSALTCGIRAQGSSEARILGTEGRIELQPFWTAEAVRILRGETVEELRFPFRANGFEYEIEEAMRCVRGGLIESQAMPLAESIAVMETMDGFREQWGLKYPME
jgi:predicted dehydrogenase